MFYQLEKFYKVIITKPLYSTASQLLLNASSSQGKGEDTAFLCHLNVLISVSALNHLLTHSHSWTDTAFYC